MPVSAGDAFGLFTDGGSITVASADTQTMNFRTNKDHPVDGNITFAASQSGPNVVTFVIIAHGTVRKPWKKPVGVYMEDHIWNHFLDVLEEFCM
jgi:hypothetical protein